MSAPGIPNLLSLRGGPHIRGGRGRGRGRGTHPPDAQYRNDSIIQATDTDAAVSRLSAVSSGYLDDPFAHFFVDGPGTRRLPIINRGTYTRTTALDILINAFLAQDTGDSKDTTPKRQIVSLGAGTDTRYFRLRAQNKHHNLVYHEFDFPSVCRRKMHLVTGNESLFNQDKTAHLFSRQSTDAGESPGEAQWGFVHSHSGNTDIRYCCHPLDLRRLSHTPSREQLENFYGLRSDLPTLVISECCLCYLEVDDAKNIMKWFADRIQSLGMILYEPLGIDDSFGQMMVENLAARNITMPTVGVYKTLSDQKQRLSDIVGKITDNHGRQEAETIERIWEEWISHEEKERVDGLEGLDEVEEWQMLARHYAVVWGWSGDSGWENWNGLQQNK